MEHLLLVSLEPMCQLRSAVGLGPFLLGNCGWAAKRAHNSIKHCRSSTLLTLAHLIGTSIRHRQLHQAPTLASGNGRHRQRSSCSESRVVGELPMRELRPLPQLVCGQRSASHAGRVTGRRWEHNGNWRRNGNGRCRRAAPLTVTGTLDQALRLVGAASATPTAVTRGTGSLR